MTVCGSKGKIEVEFAGVPSIRYDAPIAFSEGRIQCLDLVLLLVKSIAQDHRDGISRSFFEDGLLDGEQVMLIPHAAEFFHRTERSHINAF